MADGNEYAFRRNDAEAFTSFFDLEAIHFAVFAADHLDRGTVQSEFDFFMILHAAYHNLGSAETITTMDECHLTRKAR